MKLDGVSVKKAAVDAMDGEDAPKVIIDAILKTEPKLRDIEFILFGGAEEINQLIPNEQKKQIEVVATNEIIVDSDEPVGAIKREKDSSMAVATDYVGAGKANALFSLGNTEALPAYKALIIGRARGVERPALVPTLPSARSKQGFNIIDIGVNAQSKPEYLIQQIQMANFHAQEVRSIRSPTVALLNNGTEGDKGDPLHQKVYKLLKGTKLSFTGSVEGSDLMEGETDMIAADDFAENITLKTIEGTASVILRLLKDPLLNNDLRPKADTLLTKPGLTALKKRPDTARYDDAVLLSVSMPVVKTHGGSSIRPIYYTLL